MSSDQTPDVINRHGHHAWWCDGAKDGLHDDRWPYCEASIGGADAVTEKGGVDDATWERADFHVSTISAFTHGDFDGEQLRRIERNRAGVHLHVDVWDREGREYAEQSFNLTSGEARRLAAELIAGADLSDGIVSWRRQR